MPTGALSKQGVDFVFHPSAEALYPEDFSTYVEEQKTERGYVAFHAPTTFVGSTIA